MLDNLLERARLFLGARKHAYGVTFRTPMGEVVLKDLAKFCRAHSSTGHADSVVAARLDGRREVWLRVQHHLQLTDDELWHLYGERTK